MASSFDSDIPQWKKDLILRRRNQSKCSCIKQHQQQLLCTIAAPFQQQHQQSTSSATFVNCTVQQPGLTTRTAVDSVASAIGNGSLVIGKCNTCLYQSAETKMVQERVSVLSNGGVGTDGVNSDLSKNSDSDSSEELHYGPGIVNRLKNKYLSLALRENNVKTRPSILHMRKATSLENLLDDDVPNGSSNNTSTTNHFLQSRRLMHGSDDTAKNVPNRYRNAARGSDMKRAHSVETISMIDGKNEDVFIGGIEGNDKNNHNRKIDSGSNNKTLEINTENKYYTSRINRPKRVPLIMNEKEKPPADVVKQTKRIFECRSDQRNKQLHMTGEVAEKVAVFNKNIKTCKKPPLKQKPTIIAGDKNRKVVHNTFVKLPNQKPATTWCEKKKDDKLVQVPADLNLIKIIKSPTPDITSLPSPIPDVFINNYESDQNGTSLSSHTPDLIIHSSPIHTVTSPTYKINTVEKFIKEEIKHSNKTMFVSNENDQENKCLNSNNSSISISPVPKVEEIVVDGLEISSETPHKFGTSVTFNFSKKTTPSKTVEINGVNRKSPPPPLNIESTKKNVKATNKLSAREIEKNAINSATSPRAREIEKNAINAATSPPKTNSTSVIAKGAVVSGSSNSVVVDDVKIQVPKVKKPPRVQQLEQNSIVFKFTDRKEVPDYVGNDGRQTRTNKIERPKVGEGGIILLPGASLDESFTDDDDEWRHSLESPPSPCNITFINDNILIDGRSSLSQKTKRPKKRISFVDSGPEVYEYPSESSVLIEEMPTSPTNGTMGHSVPSLSGSTLANYTPKGGTSNEDFQLGVTKSVSNNVQHPTTSENGGGDAQEQLMQEVDEPILFSAGTNSDILF